MRSCGNCFSLSIIVSRSQMARFHNLWPSNIPLNISASADPMRVLELGKPVRAAWHEARSLFFINISHPPLPVTNYRMETAPGARTWHWIGSKFQWRAIPGAGTNCELPTANIPSSRGTLPRSCRGHLGVQYAAFMTATMRRKEGGRWVSFIKITEFSFKKVDHQSCRPNLKEIRSSHLPTALANGNVWAGYSYGRNEPHPLPQTIRKKLFIIIAETS